MTVSWVALLKTVACEAPLIITVELATKPVPATVTAVAVVVPACAAVGLSDVSPGTGFVTYKDAIFELPPFGAGLITITCTVPAVATSAGLIVVLSEVGVPLAARIVPFTDTSDCETKFVPLIVSVNALLPAVTPEGDSDVIFGSGLDAPVIVNVAGWLLPPPGWGVWTVINAEPAF